MRCLDLYSDDGIFKAVDLSTICEVMLEMERGERGGDWFLLAEPNLGPTIVTLSLVGFELSGATSWILHQARRRTEFFVAVGTSRKYLECIYYGTPTRLLANCLLSLDEAVPALEQFIEGNKLAPPLRWVSSKKAWPMIDC
jgi:hypothetical protein